MGIFGTAPPLFHSASRWMERSSAILSRIHRKNWCFTWAKKSSRLNEVTKEGNERVPASRLETRVRGTDITFEDIALKFLYWPSVALEGDQVIMTRGCWKLLLQPGSSKASQYGSVRLWVEKQSGAFLQADAFDKNGKLAKRFKVIAPQRINGEWILKKMRIEQMANPNDDTPTYLEIEGVEKSR